MFFSGNFGLSGFWCKGEKQRYFSRRPVHKHCVSERDFDGKNQTFSGWEIKVWILSELEMHSTYWNIWTITNPMHGSKQEPGHWIIICKRKIIDGDFVRKNHTCHFWEIWVWLSRQIK